MSPYIVGVVIGVGGTLLIWLLTTWREHLAERQRRRDYDRLVLKGALADYLAALDAAALEMMDQPVPPVLNVVDRAIDLLIKKLGLEWVVMVVVRVLRRIAYGRRLGELTDRMTAASAHLRLVAPPEVLVLMQEVDELFSGSASRSDTWKSQWPSVRERLRDGFRQALDD